MSLYFRALLSLVAGAFLVGMGQLAIGAEEYEVGGPLMGL